MNKEIEEILPGIYGTINYRPTTGTRADYEQAIMSCPGVQDVIVEDWESRKIVPVGCVRITVNGGRADDVAMAIHHVKPAAAWTEGFCKCYVAGHIFHFDHVNPIVDFHRPSLWQRIKAVFR